MAKRILGLLVVILTLLGMPIVSQAETDDGSHKSVYIILVDKLSVHDISETLTPSMSQLIKDGAIGLASNRTLRSQSTMDTSLTIGAGNLARTYSHGVMGFNLDEAVPKRGQTAGQLYKNLTGIDPNGSSSLLVNLPEIVTGMNKEKVNTLAGAMGEALRRGRLEVCVLGNGDTGEEMLRAGVVIGMDAHGQIPLGDVGPSTYIHSPTSFLRYETNYEYLTMQLLKYKSRANVMVIELSDLARLETADIPTAEIGEREKQLILREIDTFINKLSKEINPERDLLLIIAPSPAQKQVMQKDTFTPVIAYGNGFTKGFLTSGATQRDFIVANTDIAPTVLKYFGLKDGARTMIGQPIVSKAADSRDTLQEARELSLNSSTVNRLRTPLIKGYVVLQIIVILLSLLAIFYGKRRAHLFEYLIVMLVAVPLALLPLGQIRLPADWIYILAAILAAVIITAASLCLCKGIGGFKAFIALSILTAVAINIDILTGAAMIKSSVLGYDPMSGARYYGIGNEYMGILIGSTVAVAVAVYERFNSRWMLYVIGLVLLSQCYLIGGPSLGANSDGMLTAPAAFLITLALLAKLKIRPRLLLAFVGVILVIILGFTYFDMHRAPELQSHIGRAANQIALNGWHEGLIIIQRKLGMNLKLIRYTIWSWVFIVTLLVLALLVYRPIGAMGRLRKERPYLVNGFAGIITGAVVGLIVNDSGIVAASTTSIYLVVPLLLLMLRLEGPNNPAGADSNTPDNPIV